jgi:DNA-binding transcriptional MocR family regulator
MADEPISDLPCLSSLQVMIPHGVRPLPVRMDEQGMDPDHLEQQLQWAHNKFTAWQSRNRHLQQHAGGNSGTSVAAVDHNYGADGADSGHLFPWSQQGDGLPPPTRPPTAIYLIPTGHNPTGITLSPERRARLYEVRNKFAVALLATAELHV